jgi:hypothetical protein
VPRRPAASGPSNSRTTRRVPRRRGSVRASSQRKRHDVAVSSDARIEQSAPAAGPRAGPRPQGRDRADTQAHDRRVQGGQPHRAGGGDHVLGRASQGEQAEIPKTRSSSCCASGATIRRRTRPTKSFPIRSKRTATPACSPSSASTPRSCSEDSATSSRASELTQPSRFTSREKVWSPAAAADDRSRSRTATKRR